MGAPPLIWTLTGPRHGDNAQVRALAAALARRAGAQVVEKPLAYGLLRWLPNLALRHGLAALDAASRKGLAPPWPDLVIGVGRRSVPVARWVAARAAGAPIVWLGRPRAPLKWFDLVITTAQYGLPPAANVLHIDLPLTEPAEEAPEPDFWREKFSALPRPWTAVLVGGERWPVLFDAGAAHRLGQMVEAERQRTGGAWIVSTSPRTGVRQARALHEALEKPGYFYYWRPGMTARENPHRALLALADRFIVTSDSASMIAEALRTGRPVCLFDLPRSRLAPAWRADGGLSGWLLRRGLLTPPRDMRAFTARLVAAGALRPCGPEPAQEAGTWRDDSMERAVRRVLALLPGAGG